jgi:hypothetical protein
MTKANTESVQIRVQLEIQEAYQRRQRLEAGLLAVDGASKLWIDQAAMREIERHRCLHLSAEAKMMRVEQSLVSPSPLKQH